MMKPEALFSLHGRQALITGAGGHLGSAMARGLAAAGATVWCAGRRPEPLEALRDALRADGYLAEALPLDVTDAEAVQAAVAQVGPLSILINNAHSGKTGTIQSGRPEDYAGAMAVAVTAAASLTQAATPALAASGHGAVINIASMYGLVSPDPRIYGDTGHNSPPWYGAAKGGLLQLTRYLAVHLAPQTIRVNAIAPGPFPKPKVKETMGDLWARLETKTPLGRLGQPDELAGAVQFLASDASSFITGVTLPVDGGWTAW